MTTIALPRLDENLDTTSNSNSESGFGAVKCKAGNLPLKQLGYKTQIVGLTTRTTVAQTFFNPFDECIEAIYIFPLEGDIAVTGCEMWVNGRGHSGKSEGTGGGTCGIPGELCLIAIGITPTLGPGSREGNGGRLCCRWFQKCGFETGNY